LTGLVLITFVSVTLNYMCNVHGDLVISFVTVNTVFKVQQNLYARRFSGTHKSQVTQVPWTQSLKFLYACILNTLFLPFVDLGVKIFLVLIMYLFNDMVHNLNMLTVKFIV